MARELVIVDIESTGLRRDVDIAVEVAWKNVDTGATGLFVPQHSVAWVLHYGDPVALEINGYRERLISAPQDDGAEVRRLHEELTGNAFAGSNPRMDGHWLADVFAKLELDPEPQHYRFPDIASYGAGVLGIDPRSLEGLFGLCQILGVEPGDHTAMGDVIATEEAFKRLFRVRELVGLGMHLREALNDVAGGW